MESAEEYPEGQRCLAAFSRIQGKKPFEEVKAAFEKMVFQAGFMFEFWESYVLYLLRQNMADWAYDAVSVAQEVYPDCLMLDRLGALCCLELADLGLAERHIKRFWGVNPWDPFIMLGYAQVAFKKQEYQLSAMLYGEYMEHGDTSYSVMQEYAVALAYLHRFEEAVQVYLRMDSSYGPRAAIFNNIGMALAGLGRFQEATEYCRKALNLDSAYTAAWDSLGFAYLRMGRYEDAIPVFLKAIELEPNFPDAWRHLLHAYHNAGDDEKLSGARSWVEGILPGELARFERERGKELLD